MSRPILCIGTYAKTPYHIEKVGKNVLHAIEFLSKDYPLAVKVMGRIEEKMKDCKSNDQKKQLAISLGDVLEHRILPLCGNNTFSEEYQAYEAIAEDILAKELKQL